VDNLRALVFRNEMEEYKWYKLLTKMLDIVMPRFLWYGEIIEDMAGVLTTKYAGEALFCEQLDPGAGSRPAKALETIHSSGVLHGDIDLRNFRARGNDVTIIDFGFAKFREDFTDDDEWKTLVEKERHQLRK